LELLGEPGAASKIPPFLIANKTELDLEMLGGVTIGLAAGTPAPEILVEDVIEALSALGPVELTTLPGVAENVEFQLPAERNG
jgi:4-hydroxy-3-methylbut-2-en-1-yl diphosphate reductase